MSDREIDHASMRMYFGKASRRGHMCCYGSQVLTTIPINIRDILKGEKQLRSYNSRMLLVTLVDVPTSYVSFLLSGTTIVVPI